jgi:Mrp family chromosome partitioning ATPase
MGRTLDVLRRADAAEAGRAEGTQAPPAGAPQLQVVTDEAEEMPFIEVGGKGKSVEGSPDVLAVALKPTAARAPSLAPHGPLTVTFRPCRAAPVPSPRMAPEVIAYHQPEHEVSKHYRALLGEILTENEDGRVLLFTALSPAAGVTTALLNLAVSASAAEGREVVVVDANLQRPGLASRLGLSDGPGLRDLLAGSAALEQAVRGTVQERLHALTAGSPSARASGLTAEALRWVVAWLRQRYELVFLDGPAWAEGAEPAALVAAADGVLFVLAQAEADGPQVRAATRAVARVGGRLRGLLVTQ